MKPDHALASLLHDYRGQHPDELASCELFDAFLASHDDVFERHHPPGHFTGSAWLLSGDQQRVLLTHHRKLERWLQLGGHADGERDLPNVALREACEESSLTGLRVAPAIFDIDRHAIPARGNEPEHWHYDVRFVVCADTDEQFTVSDESHALAWRDVRTLAEDSCADDSLRRMAQKWLSRVR